MVSTVNHIFYYVRTSGSIFCLDAKIVEVQLKVSQIIILEINYSASKSCHPFWEAMKTLCSYLL